MLKANIKIFFLSLSLLFLLIFLTIIIIIIFQTVANDFYYNSLANDIITLNMSEDSSNSLQYPPGSIYSTYKSMIYNSSMPSHALNRILSQIYNNMMLTKTRRQRRAPSPNGIHYECCLKGCSFNEMRAYCL